MVYGVGIYERGKHVAKIGDKHTKEYLVWHSMLSRCYNINYHGFQNYANVGVCEEWLDFQNFAEWFDKNYYTIDDDVVLLEKDFASFAYDLEKTYSPNNCIFLPQIFNKTIVFKHQRTMNLPVGVKKSTVKTNPYTINTVSRYNDKYKTFATVEDAYEFYLKRTYSHLEYDLKQYADKIPQKFQDVVYDFIAVDGLRKMHKMQKLKNIDKRLSL